MGVVDVLIDEAKHVKREKIRLEMTQMHAHGEHIDRCIKCSECIRNSLITARKKKKMSDI